MDTKNIQTITSLISSSVLTATQIQQIENYIANAQAQNRDLTDGEMDEIINMVNQSQNQLQNDINNQLKKNQ
jgi:uncharacterized surface protein with fasciclin (FAS1) repeats